jgi:pimeloyl-ACP methyl ester carboxylesterase
MNAVTGLLSARRFHAVQLVDGRLYFISDLSGRLSLYAMNYGGSMPEPLLPPQISLQNPDLIDGTPYAVFPSLGQIMVMIDQDGDEQYQPHSIPLAGGIPQPLFPADLGRSRVACEAVDTAQGIVYFAAQSCDSSETMLAVAHLATGQFTVLSARPWSFGVAGVAADHQRVALIESYTSGDHVLLEWSPETGVQRRYGTLIEHRHPDVLVELNAIGSCCYTPGNRGMIFITALFDDGYGLGYLAAGETAPQPVVIDGARHSGVGELVGLESLGGNRYLVSYNIDGCSWCYEASFDEDQRRCTLMAVLVGHGMLSDGVVESIDYDRASDRFVTTFSSAVAPTQIVTIEGSARTTAVYHTRERFLGYAEDVFASGEDASFNSHDGLRMSARLYLPAPCHGFSGPRPLVYYIHGGPQSQERPDFSWFSMPLIQLLTIEGFAVFVPNVRGSTGYGMRYTTLIDRDWGGADMADHVAAMEYLRYDPRIDVQRAGVIGRSYGGYMTLMLASRHPHLWSAAVDMFGPYDLLSFLERIPPTWKPYFQIAVGDPVVDRAHLIERSPATHIDALRCPLLVIQGRNDPRVVEHESADLVARLTALGRDVRYLVFENEGHDVLKFENRVTCYSDIAAFFRQHLLAGHEQASAPV